MLFQIRPKAITDAQWREVKARWDKYDKICTDYGDNAEKKRRQTTKKIGSLDGKSCHPPAAKVYVRIRPLNEIEMNDGCMEGLVSETRFVDDKENGSGVVAIAPCVGGTRREPIGGFDGIFGPMSDNKEVFQHALKDDLQLRVLNRGGKVNVFCYGHTGSGKTHSMLGYASEPGLYQLSSDLLLDHLEQANALMEDENEKLGLNIRFTELYNGEVYDLINNRRQLILREDDAGNLHIRTAADLKEDGRVYMSDQHAALVSSTNDIMKVLKDGVQRRAVGSSSLHDQSSRSHALLTIEIVTRSILNARKAVAEADAHVHPIGKAADDAGIAFFSELFNYNPSDNSFTAKCDIVGEKQMTGEEWVRLHEELCNKCVHLHVEKESAEKVLEEAKEALKQTMLTSKGHNESVGGTVTLIDLAGSDSDHRDLGLNHTKVERKESNQINSDLLSLKECIRAMSLKQKKLPFRNSKLTRVLKSTLMPQSDQKNVQTVMLSTVSPSAVLEKQTINTIRYAQMVGAKNKPSAAPRVNKKSFNSAVPHHLPVKNIST